MTPSAKSTLLHFTTFFAGGLIGALSSAVVGYFIFRPPAYAHFYCNRYNGLAPLAVSCDNESQYAARVVWDFGDRTPIQIGNVVTHKYAKGRVKPYKITLTAFGDGRNSSYTQQISVRRAAAIANPFTVALSAQLAEKTVNTKKICRVSFMKNNHPNILNASTESFSRTCSADPGFRIVNAQFAIQSSSGATQPTVSVKNNGNSATVSADLTSGPILNQYRSWLTGELLLQQKGHTSELSSANLTQQLHAVTYRSYKLNNDFAIHEIKSLQLTVNGKKIAWKDPSKPMVLTNLATRLRLAEGKSGLKLVVEKQGQ